MFYFKKIIRYILGIGGILGILGFFIETFELHLLGFLAYPNVIYFVFLYLPALLLLPIVSVCNYFINKRFWSEFKTEYYFWFAQLGLCISLDLIELLVVHLKK
jgi:hypothetical protein